MRQIGWIILLSLFIAIVNCNCNKKKNSTDVYSPGDYSYSIMHNSLKRTYLIHIPSSYDKTKVTPLVVALHGGGGQGKNMKQLTLNGFDKLADKDGFVVIYPDGIERHWNDGRKELSYRAHKENIDDVGFISALIDHLAVKLNIDQKRIYVTGISNGAKMSFRIACELTDKIAAIATVGGSMLEDMSVYPQPSKPISVMIIHGTKDPLVPYSGGDIHLGRQKLGRVISAADTAKYWVIHNQCTLVPSITDEPDTDPNDGTRVKKEVYGNGKNGSEVIFYTIEGGGHTWPSGYQYLAEWIIGKTNKDIDANQIIWEFFKKCPAK